MVERIKKVVSLAVAMFITLAAVAAMPTMAYKGSTNSVNSSPNIQSNHSGWTSIKPIEVNISEIKQAGKPKSMSFNDIKIGDIIATGKRSSPKELCQVSFGIAHEFANGERGSKHVTTKVDENCNVIVVEKNESLQPSSVSIGSATTLDPQHTTDAFIYMYGYGGTADPLTERYAKMTFGYDGNSAWKVSGDDGACSWVPDGWVNTACTYYWNPTSGSSVYMQGEGDFHWWANSYQHSLYTAQTGTKSGGYSCNYWYTGSIVSGTTGWCDVLS